MSHFTAAERSTLESIIASLERSDHRRRRLARVGWALLVTAAVAIPVTASALDNTISSPAAIIRVVAVLAVALITSALFGALLEKYKTLAALKNVEDALTSRRWSVHEPGARMEMDEVHGDT